MEGRRAPQGLAAEDRLALGLTASHLSYLLVGSLTGYAMLSSHLPGPVKIPLGIVAFGLGSQVPVLLGCVIVAVAISLT